MCTFLTLYVAETLPLGSGDGNKEDEVSLSRHTRCYRRLGLGLVIMLDFALRGSSTYSSVSSRLSPFAVSY